MVSNISFRECYQLSKNINNIFYQECDDTKQNIKRSEKLDNEYMIKYGHPYHKKYEEGDEDKYVFPEKDEYGVLMYQKYVTYDNKTSRLVKDKCGCEYNYFKISDRCKELNTTHYYGLEIPLNNEDFNKMKDILINEYKMKLPDFYNWLYFWHDKVCNRTYYNQLSFFHTYKFDDFNLGPKYRFFSYVIFRFINEKRMYQNYIKYRGKSTVRIVNRNCHATVCSAYGLLKLSLELYKEGKVILYTNSNFNSYSNIIWSKKYNNTFDNFYQFHKVIYNNIINEIKNEVSYRPGKVNMLNAEDDFYTNHNKIYKN